MFEHAVEKAGAVWRLITSLNMTTLETLSFAIFLKLSFMACQRQEQRIRKRMSEFQLCCLSRDVWAGRVSTDPTLYWVATLLPFIPVKAPYMRFLRTILM